MLRTLARNGNGWRFHQPVQLRRIEDLAVDMSKISHEYGEDKKNWYLNEKCEEIKQLTHDYQKSVGYRQ